MEQNFLNPCLTDLSWGSREWLRAPAHMVQDPRLNILETRRATQNESAPALAQVASRDPDPTEHLPCAIPGRTEKTNTFDGASNDVLTLLRIQDGAI